VVSTQSKFSMDWTCCIICQDNSAPLSCPQNGQRNAREVYQDFLANVEAFKALNALPVVFNFGMQGTVKCFMENKACWHHICHQKFNKSKLKREVDKKTKKEQEKSSEVRHSTRQVAVKSANTCIFCDKGDPDLRLHDYTTDTAGEKLKLMATEMQDSKILPKILCSDLVASGAKYHDGCLTDYQNRYRSLLGTRVPQG